MALSKFENANLKRLIACRAPNVKKIDALRAKVKRVTEEAVAEIKELEAQNEGFNNLIEELLRKAEELENTSENISNKEVVANNPIEVLTDPVMDDEEENDAYPLPF